MCVSTCPVIDPTLSSTSPRRPSGRAHLAIARPGQWLTNGFMSHVTLCLMVSVVLLFVRMPVRYGWFGVEPRPLRPLWPLGEDQGTETTKTEMDALARDYVTLVLGLGVHDPDAVDAYYGPAELQAAVKARPPSLDQLRLDAARLRTRLEALASPTTESDTWRLRMLRVQVRALETRLAMRLGTRLPFDRESAGLYDAVAPTHGAAHFEALLSALDRALPGEGPVGARYEEFRAAFVIPPARLPAVFATAIDACRSRTRAHITLPADERFTLEYVTDKPWSGYNWYKGGYRSVIQVNTDLPIYIDRALDLACHEGYPGHHVYNVLLEHDLVRRRQWVEWSVYPLFSPQSLIAEGTANFGIDVAFPAADRLAFERDVLYPLATLDPGRAAHYHEVQRLAARLAYAGNEAARGYLDGQSTRDEAIAWLERYALMGRERATQRVRFFDRYRSYVINYNLGQDLVQAFVDGQAGAQAHPTRRWDVFAALLRRPRLPSELVASATSSTSGPS